MDTALTQTTPLRIFVTGATTPLGQVVTRRFSAAGHHVYGVAERSAGATLVRKNGGLPLFVDPSRAAELESNLRMSKAEVVIHLAPQAANHVPFRNADWDAENLAAHAAALSKAAAAAGVKFLVHTSYAFVVGEQGGAWTDETTAPKTSDNPLLKATARAEKAVLNGQVPACVLRLGYLYGAESEELSEVAATLRLGRPLVTGEGLLNWVHLEDAAEAIRRAAEGQPAGEIFNVVDGSPVSSAQFLTDFAKALGIQPPGNPPKFAQRLLLSSTQSELMALSAQCKAAKIGEALGWTPLYPNHVPGIEQTLLSWRAASA